MIDDNIREIQYKRFGEKTTVCFIKLNNGFELIGTSACIDKNNFSGFLGEKYALENAMLKLIEFNGYEQHLTEEK